MKNLFSTKRGIAIVILIALILVIGIGSVIAFGSQFSKPDTKMNITIEKAQALALKDAKLDEADVSFTEKTFDTDDKVYEFDFRTKSNEYEYEVDAEDGSIIKRESNPIDNKSDNTTAPLQSDSNQNTEISTDNNSNIANNTENNNTEKSVTLDKAKKIALNHADVKNVTFTKTKTDYENGVKVYDIQFYTSDAEYKYEIDTKTGKIIDYDVDYNQ